MKNKRDVLRSLGVIFLIIGVVIAYRYFVNNKYMFTSENVKIIRSEWTYNGDTIDQTKLNLEADEAYTVSTVLSNDFIKKQYILIRSSLSNVTVHLNDIQIFDYQIDTGLFKAPPASLWHVVEIPEISHGNTLDITYQSPYAKMNGKIKPVLYGNRGDLMFYILVKYGQPFIIDLIILLFGIIMLLIAFIVPRNMNNNIWFIGVFAVLASLWLISESKMLQFFTGNQVLIGSLPFICLALLPIPFLYYVKNIVSKDKERLIKKFVLGSFLVFIFIMITQVFDLIDLFETLIVSHVYMAIAIVSIFAMILHDIRVKKNMIAMHILYALCTLLAFTLIEMFRFYFLDATDVTVFVRIGLLVFILMLSQETAKQIFLKLKKSHHAEFFEKMAYLDQLTQGPNRMAFEKDLEAVFNDASLREHLRLVILDVNRLKVINDTHGHVTGDDAIRTAFNLIDRHFGPIGRTYRIGGDEFACIIMETDESTFDQISSDFDASVQKFNNKLYYQFGIALGSVLYDVEQDLTVKQLMHRADSNMYVAKRSGVNLA